MYQAFDIAAVLRLYRYDITAIPHGNQIFLQVFLIDRRMDQLIELVFDLQPSVANFPPDIRQRRTGMIRHQIFREDRRLNSFFDKRMRRQPMEQIIQRGLSRFAASAPIRQGPDGPKRVGYVQQLFEREAGT